MAPRRMYVACVVFLTLAPSCRSAGGDPPPVAQATPAPRPVPPPPVTEATPAWQRRIQAEVSALRGLAFKKPVGYGVQSRKDFRAFVRTELEREMPALKTAALSRSYAQLGFIGAGFDLRAALEEALTTQVAAYYDPRTKALRVVEKKRSSATGHQQDDEVVAHELQHALQDQHFDLLTFDGEEPGSGLDEDEQMARRFVVEGEAMFVMQAWQMGSGSGSDRRLGPLAVAGLRMSVAMLAAGDMMDILAAMRQGADGAASLPEETRAEIEALVQLPPVIVTPLIEPYLKGALMVSEAWARGGWPAVDDLFRHPPRSTEQALHPVEKLLVKRDAPVHIQAPAPLPPVLASATPLSSEVLGELGWRIYFKTVGQPHGEDAAAGWGGDRFWSYQIGDRPVVLTATRWDSEAEARQFLAAYAGSLRRRFPRVAFTSRGETIRLARPEGGLISVERRGLDVDIVDGAMAAELPALQAFLKSARRH